MANSTQEKIPSRITDWPIDERPRERLMKNGANSVSSAELIAILLGQGSARHNAVDTAKHLLSEFKSLQGLANASLVELQKIPGIGPAKAVTLLAAFQLYRNMQQESAEKSITKFTDPAAVAEIYIPVIGHLKKESFYVILLDSAMKKIQDMEISRGILTESLVHPREVFNPAIRHNAKGLIVLHNHPSGVAKPSTDDRSMTTRLIESGKILSIPLYDHLIITEKGYYSFRENGLI
ncbi:MAG: JAB domain-containing protein [Calditrichaeota bacterium]|nr:MAG: JAB domain-containing protein [Calditrichota bacterium]MBL1203953.1 JAB domain-containing protein [Calditrichota bacterium]NOG43784.1 DNA repair protein RadC [Calditrichota bacterium]